MVHYVLCTIKVNARPATVTSCCFDTGEKIIINYNGYAALVYIIISVHT